jgi:uncharacterized protein (DUF885 family)
VAHDRNRNATTTSQLGPEGLHMTDVGDAQATTPEAEERARAARDLADRYWDQVLELEPILATIVGDDRFDHLLPDPSEEGRTRRHDIQSAALAESRAFDKRRLGSVERTTLDILEAAAERDLDSLRYRTDRLSALSHLWGPASLLGDIGSVQQAGTPERLERYFTRLERVPWFMDRTSEVVEEGAATGQTVPKIVADRTIRQVERTLEAGPEGSPALTPVIDQPEARDRVLSLLRDDILPAYGRYLDALRAYLPRARDTLGLGALPSGDEIYAAEIRGYTTLGLTPMEIHEIGKEDLARLRRERFECAARLGHDDPATATAEHNASGRNTATSREQVLELARAQVERAWEAAGRIIGRMPSVNCEVRPIEEFREADMPFAYYQSPSADNSRPGIYYVNTSDLGSRPLNHLATTTYHEANPGHHLQLSVEQELQDRPRLRRFGGILAGSAFIEGWALYSERLADELGLFLDEYERLGMLDSQAWRSARLVVDTGIHAFGWERDRCIRVLEEAGVPHLDAMVETDRYVALPAQALAYKLGQIEIERWRAAITEREGSGFSLPSFHDRLLSLGSLPLGALERELFWNA